MAKTGSAIRARPKRSLRIFLSIAAITVVVSGSLAVMQARSQYYGVCSTLTGFPGLMQQARLLQGGTCKSLPGGTLCNAGSACTVNGSSGQCKNTGRPGGAVICTCLVIVL